MFTHHSEVFIHPPTIFLFDFPNACQSTLQARQTGRLVSVKRARLWFCVTLRSWTTLYCCLSIDTAYKSMDDTSKKKKNPGSRIESYRVKLLVLLPVFVHLREFA